uniref:Uncharacterized protein n=1 Tax=Strigamia maritima TaxID=126957 RepID=T1JJ11_STRMM
MRFVQLQNRKKAPLEAVIYYKCGPNFVAKRKGVFEFMLKQQSFTFWFRFWLTFSCYPVYTEISVIQKRWPRLTAHLALNIYRHFLQVPVSARQKFCMNLISALNETSSDTVENLREKSTKEVFECFRKKLHEYWKMAFAIALCDVFFKWLLSSDMHDKSQTYWLIPQQYLSPDYKPSIIEEFLTDEWKDKLFKLLGVDEKKIPWYREITDINRQLRPINVVKSSRADRSAYIKYIKLITKVIVKQKKKFKKQKIHNKKYKFLNPIIFIIGLKKSKLK